MENTPVIGVFSSYPAMSDKERTKRMVGNEEVIFTKGAPEEWFSGTWGTPEVREFFDGAREEQHRLGICKVWAREVGKYTAELLGYTGLPRDEARALLVKDTDLRSKRPLALQIAEAGAMYEGKSTWSYLLTSVDVETGEDGPTCMTAITATASEGLLVPSDKFEAVFDDDQRLALHGLLTWQRKRGLILPER